MYRIYIVEDDKGIAEGIEGCLKTWGMEGRVVSDFRNVMDEISSYDPHLVIMDITLPFMGGYHWCQEIRKTSSVPIIFISSASDNKIVYQRKKKFVAFYGIGGKKKKKTFLS